MQTRNKYRLNKCKRDAQGWGQLSPAAAGSSVAIRGWDSAHRQRLQDRTGLETAMAEATQSQAQLKILGCFFLFLLFHFVLFLKRQLEDLWSLSRELALAGLDPSWLWARASTWAGNPSCSRVLPALPGSQAVPPSRLALAVPRARL